MKIRACLIPSCENKLSERTRSDICTTCRSSFYYWMKRKPAHMLARRYKLKLWDERLEQLLGGKK